VEYLRHPERFTRLGGKLPKGILLTGPPGTGKTLLARAVAGEAGVPFFYRAGSEFEEMFVGVGSRRVRALFAAAKKKAPCIVFIDEIDAIGGSRKAWEANSRKTLNQLLVEMDGFEASEGVVVLAATNLAETLDPALTRPGRFDRTVHVPVPDVGGRRAILQHYLKDKPVASDLDVGALARGTSGFSGAELSNLVNVAAIRAAVLGEDRITASLLDWARDRVLMGNERRSAVISDENRRLTAFHEGGHALVALRTPGAHPVHKATIMPRGSSLGMVQQLPDTDETSVSLRQMRARLDVCMGGRVAEELVFGLDAVTSGARSDLQQATALARHMVSECGMSDALGPMYLSDSGGTGRFKPSADTERAVDEEVRRLLKESYDRVRLLLKASLPELHDLATALLERETLTGDQVKAILAAASKGGHTGQTEATALPV
jgi:ATP-dependent metalloprotease